MRPVSVALIVLCGLVTAAFRFLGTREFNNDHFVHLTAAQQMFFGEWPTRDFIDIGRPLQIVASAAAQRLIGHDLFAEALLVSAAFGIAAALTAAVVLRLTGSAMIAVAAVIVEVAAFPRTYSYPKVLAIAAGLWVIGYFFRRPVFGRLVAMAAGVAIAFLLRHDLGAFVGVGALVASILAIPGATRRERGRSALTFVLLVAVMIAPYLIYVQVNGGLQNYAATALEQNQTEAEYDWPSPFAAGNAWDAQLLYLFHLLPLVALGVCAMARKRGRDGWRAPFVISVACVAVVANFGLIRDELRTRLPDAIVPAVVLGAWLVHHASTARPRYFLVPAVVVFAWAGFALGDAANFGEIVNRANLRSDTWLEPRLLPVRFAERSAQLQRRFGSSSPSRAAFELRPFIQYLDRCTTEQHRLFLGGLIPEVAYLARRPFAGGGYEHYNFSSPANQQRVVDRLGRQLVPFALIPSPFQPELADLPIVAAYIREHYVALADVPVGEDAHIDILIDKRLQAVSRDAETGWPCFR